MPQESLQYDFLALENSKKGQKVHEVEIFDYLSTDLRTPCPEDNSRRECRKPPTFEKTPNDSYIPENMEKHADFIFKACSSRHITQDREEIPRIKKPKITHCEEQTINSHYTEHNNDHQNEMLERCSSGLITPDITPNSSKNISETKKFQRDAISEGFTSDIATPRHNDNSPNNNSEQIWCCPPNDFTVDLDCDTEVSESLARGFELNLLSLEKFVRRGSPTNSNPNAAVNTNNFSKNKTNLEEPSTSENITCIPSRSEKYKNELRSVIDYAEFNADRPSHSYNSFLKHYSLYGFFKKWCHSPGDLSTAEFKKNHGSYWIHPYLFMRKENMEKVDILLEYLLDRFLNPYEETYIDYTWNRSAARISKETGHHDFNTSRYIEKSGEIYCSTRTAIFDPIYASQTTIMAQYPKQVSINTHYILIPFFFEGGGVRKSCCDSSIHNIKKITTEPCGTLYIMNDNINFTESNEKHKLEVSYGSFNCKIYKLKAFIDGVLEYNFDIHYPCISRSRVKYCLSDSFLVPYIQIREVLIQKISLNDIYEKYLLDTLVFSVFKRRYFECGVDDESYCTGKSEVRKTLSLKIAYSITRLAINTLKELRSRIEIFSDSTVSHEIIKKLICLSITLVNFNTEPMSTVDEHDAVFLNAYAFINRQLSVFKVQYLAHDRRSKKTWNEFS